MADRNRPHIQVPIDARWRSRVRYTPYSGGGRGDRPGPPAGGRPAHAAELKTWIDTAVANAGRRQASTTIDVNGAKPGLYLEFE
jgi:hypothetical protein